MQSKRQLSSNMKKTSFFKHPFLKFVYLIELTTATMMIATNDEVSIETKMKLN